MTKKSNLLLIPFNRPHYLKRVLKNFDRINFNKVFAFIDGPRNAADATGIAGVKKILQEHGIETINSQSKNLGINAAFETAISWFFDNVEDGIILEEDCVADESFFSFAQEMLEKYRNQKQIGMITGSNAHPNSENSYFFSHQFGIWGWATWKDRWQKYTRIKKSEDIQFSFVDLLKFSGSFAGALTLQTKFKRLTSRSMGFWDMNWTYTNVINNWLCIIPNKNLITNIGHFGNSSFKKTQFHDLKTEKMIIKKLTHPEEIKINTSYDRYLDWHHNLLPAVKSFIYQTINYKKFN